MTPFLHCQNGDICNLACQVLASLAQLFQGRLAILQASGLEAILAALGKAPESGISCLQVCTLAYCVIPLQKDVQQPRAALAFTHCNSSIHTSVTSLLLSYHPHDSYIHPAIVHSLSAS